MVPCGLMEVEAWKDSILLWRPWALVFLFEQEPESTLNPAGKESSSLVFFLHLKIFLVMLHSMGILVPKPGISLCPLHLQLGVWTSGPPEKSQESKSLAIPA